MSRLVVELPNDRCRTGRLQLLDQSDAVTCGPFPVAGVGSSTLAAANRNASRNPILPYGNTPTGRFVIRAHIGSGNGSPLPKSEYGPVGIVILEGVTGDAALADANGRFNFAIQAGDLSSTGQLRSTAGALRLRNSDLRFLLRALARTPAVACEIVEVGGDGGDPVYDDDKCALIDPLPSALTQPNVRSTAGMLPRPGTALLAMGASFAVQGSLSAAPLESVFANRQRMPEVRAVHWVPAAAAAAAADGQAYNPPGIGNVNVDTTTQYIDQHATTKSRGECAKACRLGLEAGGMQISPNERPPDAKGYVRFFDQHSGATQIDNEPAGTGTVDSSKFQKGDVAVFEGNAAHPHGHMQIFDGTNWVSDFKQKGFSPYKDKSTTPPSHIYRPGSTQPPVQQPIVLPPRGMR